MTLYTGILGVAFAVAESPLPLRGVYTAIFLALAIALSTVFLAFLPEASEEETISSPEPEVEVPGLGLANFFIRWTRAAALNRARWLRASVVALAVGVLFLPAPFITAGSTSVKPADVVWPDPGHSFAGRNIELRKIVYTAQVNEVAERAKAAKPVVKTNDWAWFVIFMVGLASVIGVLLFSTSPLGMGLGIGIPVVMVFVPLGYLGQAGELW